MSFMPIALVGQGCVLPGAPNPEALWRAVAGGQDLTTSAPRGAWLVDPADIIGPDGESFRDGTRPAPRRGGFVTGFEDVFDPTGFQLPAEDVVSLDRSVQWLFEATRQAVTDARCGDLASRKTAVVLGNNAYPSASLVDIANQVLIEEPLGLSTLPSQSSTEGRRYLANRFSAGRPAHLLARAFAANGPAFCLDAACASSLYAVKLACDYLQDGTADVALAGAYSGTDNIFLHLGFAEINALSPTGMSRPFSRLADGLLPAEGAAMLVLKRLDDAVRNGDKIHAVIRGLGLSNDGRGGGLLSPAKDGQIAAIRRAYELAEVEPASISLLECHATGTPTGDRVELESAAAVFGQIRDLPVGSLKSNVGHLLTAAGVGGILKVVGAMANNMRPPTLHAGEPLTEFDGTAMRPLQEAEPWPEAPCRRAGVSNFGFGGNNAHLILEEYSKEIPIHSVKRPPADDPIVICGVGAIAGDATGFDQFARRVFATESTETTDKIDEIKTPFRGLTFPPADLRQCLGQQTATLEACRISMSGVTSADPERCGVIIGMGCDVDAGRPGLRYRLGDTIKGTDFTVETEDEGELLAATGGLAGPAYVMGAMPNIPANRVNVHHDWRGYGYTVAGEELSGVTALEIAARSLKTGELDLAVAGAVDLSHEQVHRLAASAVLPDALHRPADAAIVFALKRRSTAEAAGDRILGTIEVEASQGSAGKTVVSQPGPKDVRFGHAHAAAAMVQTAAALAATSAGIDLKTRRLYLSEQQAVSVTAASFTGQSQTLRLLDVTPSPGFGVKPDAAHLFFAAGETLSELRDALEERERSSKGRLRIAISASNRQQLETKITAAIRQIDAGKPVNVPGVHFGDRAQGGEVAFMYPGTAARYPGMAEDLALAFPEVIADFRRRSGVKRVARFYSEPMELAGNLAQAASMAFVGFLGTRILRDHLGVTPTAALGVSIGEVSMLAAHEVWPDPAPILDALEASSFYHKVAGDHPSIINYLARNGQTTGAWQNHEIIAPVEQVEAAVREIPNVWITIVASPSHCAIGGAAESCRAVAARFGSDAVIRSDIDLAFHGPFAADAADGYKRAHTQPVAPVDGVRFYFNAKHEAAEPDTETIAACLSQQMLSRVDFRPTVEKAWADGVRIFVDIGPRRTTVAAVSAILGDRPHLAIGLDNARRNGLLQLTDAAAALFAAGVPVDLDALLGRLAHLRGDVDAAAAATQEKMLSMPAHLPPVQRHVLERSRKRKPGMNTGDDNEAAFVISQPPVLSPSRQQPPASRNENAEVTGGSTVIARGGKTSPDVPQGPTRPMPVQRQEPKAKERGPKASPFDPTPTAVRPLEVLEPEGPAFDREQLEVLAGGAISTVFGPLFAQQDGYARQCRMPQPPLLLADRVLGMAGEPGSMGKGVCWTETDITDDSWYLDNGSMPTGLLIEAGQADLLLISWLGVDFLNRDERVYRLLGCEIVFHDGPLPTAGDTLGFQIHIDGHASVGDTRMFFFRYDARIGDRLVSSVRNGQAGFFSDAELAGSDGVLWSAETDAPKPDARLDAAPRPTTKRSFTSDEVRGFAEGNAFSCFGEGFEMAAPHQRTPGIPRGRMQLIDRVSAFEPTGGPWGRGYLKAECDVPTDAWFYDGHFKNDPCMPGTLMADAAAQALQFHMAALGFTIDRDGWVFRAVTGETFKFVCRGQVIPDRPHLVTYEVFVEEIIDGDEPTVYAALLARSDGHKVFLCRRFGVKLVRDWPLYTKQEHIEDQSDTRIVSPTGDVPGDHSALLACAWGKPTDAFGTMYERFDRESNIPRLPGPPYHCISRIVSIDCEPGVPTPGGKVITEFDVDPKAWYLADSGNNTMPFSIITEVLLQPCGWLASYMGFALPGDLKLRNLDGMDVRIEREIGPNSGTLTVEATFTKSAAAGPTSIVFYEIVCRSSEGRVVTLKTDFGLFPAEALISQRGLPVSDERRAALTAAGGIDPKSLLADPFANDVCAGSPDGRLAMVDAVTGFWPDGGSAGLGRVTGIQTIDPSSWYFKAHFYDDPVQPGSLGLEALFNLFKAAVKLKGLHDGFAAPRFEAPANGTTLNWKYRGQVIPTNKQVITEIDIVDITNEGSSILVTAEGSLWVDGLRIYEVSGYALRIGEDKSPRPRTATKTRKSRSATDLAEWVVDAAADPWLAGHCPTFAVPVYPMMGIVGDLLNAEGQDRVTGLADVELNAWLRLDQGPITLLSKTYAMPDGRVSRQLFQRIAGKDKRIGRAFEIETQGYPEPPPRWSNLAADGEQVDPYSSCDLFHHGAFAVGRDMVRSETASRFWFDAAKAWENAHGSPTVLLDAMVHGFPRWQPSLSFGEAAAGFAAFPYRLETFQLFAELPRDGVVEVLTRAGEMPTPRTLRLGVQVIRNDLVIAEFSLLEALVPLGIFDRLPADQRRQFGRDHQFAEGWTVADIDHAGTTLSRHSVREANWLPGTLEAIYGLPFDGSLDEGQLTERVAIKDHFATRYRLHPSEVRVEDGTVFPGMHAPTSLANLDLRWRDADTFWLGGAEN
ncbi:MAG: beta-ketoacyl synthase N-terminal-like domain-containing protein [Pseudomonadota bacterium]